MERHEFRSLLCGLPCVISDKSQSLTSYAGRAETGPNFKAWLLLGLRAFVLPSVGCGGLPVHLLVASHGETLHMAHSDLNNLMARNRFLF